jgi:hypothetical protein
MQDSIVVSERCIGEWRIVASAWLVAIALVALFATADALASRPDPLPRIPRLAGAEIPRHDPGFPGPDEVAASDWLEKARIESYSCW